MSQAATAARADTAGYRLWLGALALRAARHYGVQVHGIALSREQQQLAQLRVQADGLFLNHGITSEKGWQRTPLTRFMNPYIFPDGELARISEVVSAMERAGFEIVDVESLRRHYALTLRHWVHALEENRSKAITQPSVTTYRLWRLYMAGRAFYFDEGGIGVHQVLAGRRHSPLQLLMDDLYTSHEAEEEGARGTGHNTRCVNAGVMPARR